MGKEMDGRTNGEGSPDLQPRLHVAMFPWFGFGHISPFLQLANKLAGAGVKVTFLSAPGNVPRITAALKSPPENPISVVLVRIPPFDGLPPGVDSTYEMTPPMAELLKLAVDKMSPDIETLLAEHRPHAVFYDFCHGWLPDIAGKLGIKSFFFSVFSASSGAYITSPARKPHGAAAPTVEEMKKPPLGLGAEGVRTFEAQDFLYAFMEFGGPSVYDRVLNCFRAGTAVVLKSCLEMEAQYINYLAAQYGKQFLLAGPVVPEPPTEELDPAWSEWLNRFPENSVIFCSFGSETFLRDEQIKELSLGLEMTKKPFILVLNFPEKDSGTRLREALPEGLEERVKDRGVVRTGWVQQQLILGHSSVGCFVNHAGFSSVAEGLVHDCQLVLLPQRGDQYLNARLVSQDMKAGVEVRRRDEDGHFVKEDVCEAVETVMGPMAEEDETEKMVRSTHIKWMEFFRDEKMHRKFTTDFVDNLKRVIYTVH